MQVFVKSHFSITFCWKCQKIKNEYNEFLEQIREDSFLQEVLRFEQPNMKHLFPINEFTYDAIKTRIKKILNNCIEHTDMYIYGKNPFPEDYEIYVSNKYDDAINLLEIEMKKIKAFNKIVKENISNKYLGKSL